MEKIEEPKYKTVSLKAVLHNDLTKLAVKVAKKDGLSVSTVGIPQLIERMKKVYEDTIEL